MFDSTVAVPLTDRLSFPSIEAPASSVMLLHSPVDEVRSGKLALVISGILTSASESEIKPVFQLFTLFQSLSVDPSHSFIE